MLENYFGKYSPTFLRNLEFTISSMLKTGSSNTSILAQNMNFEANFKANDMRMYRFLQNLEFQIDDKLWRCHANLVFDALLERNFIKKDSQILIKVDFTTSLDHFLILLASVDMNGRSIPLYFTMRNYPKSSGQMNQKKMEQAFIKGLRHILSKKYSYIIVADRGFGNQRFSRLCNENGFDYVLRMNENLGLLVEEKCCNLEDYAGENFDISATVRVWKEKKRFVGSRKNNEYWIIMTSLSDNRDKIVDLYTQRFGIEKCFQDQKSSGFDIEKSKIRKYDRFKRLLFCVCLSQVLVVILGELLTFKNHPIKKKYPAHINALLAFLSLDKELSNRFLQSA